MLHTIVTILVSACAYPFGLHYESSFAAAMFYIGREHAQAEYRAIKSFYGGKRANAPWWCGFERRAWGAKAMVDWLGPMAIAVAVMAV